VRIADNSSVYAPSHTVHLQCTALQDVTFVRLRLRLEMVYHLVGKRVTENDWAGWDLWALVLPVAMNGEESFGVVAQGLFADAKRNNPFVDFGYTQLLHLRCF
jgi:hypothetical protein